MLERYILKPFYHLVLHCYIYYINDRAVVNIYNIYKYCEIKTNIVLKGKFETS